MGASWKTLMWWERNEREPDVRFYPAIIQFLGYEPWPEPATLPEALLAERRRRGLEIRKAAAVVGVDEGTWRRWEQGEWRPTRRTAPALDALFGRPVRSRYPSDVR
jgi:transcriptional regulator with XRE-family HTH domain